MRAGSGWLGAVQVGQLDIAVSQSCRSGSEPGHGFGRGRGVPEPARRGPATPRSASIGASTSAEGGIVIDTHYRLIGMPVFGPRRWPLVVPSATIERVAPGLLADGRSLRLSRLGHAGDPSR